MLSQKESLAVEKEVPMEIEQLIVEYCGHVKVFYNSVNQNILGINIRGIATRVHLVTDSVPTALRTSGHNTTAVN